VAELVIDENTRLIVPSNDVIIGRRDAKTGFFPDLDLSDLAKGMTVSRRHARLFQRNRRWYVQASPTARNGTFVSGRRLSPGQEALVKEGDEIRLGDVTLAFYIGQDSSSAFGSEYTDEFHVGSLKFPLSLEEGQTVVIGRKDAGYFPDVDLASAPEGMSVFPHHAQVFRSSGETFLQVQEEARQQTLYCGSPLESTRPIALKDGDKLQFARVVATFRRTWKESTSTLILTYGGDSPNPDASGQYQDTPEFSMSLDEKKMNKEVEEVGRVIDRLKLLEQIKRRKRD